MSGKFGAFIAETGIEFSYLIELTNLRNGQLQQLLLLGCFSGCESKDLRLLGCFGSLRVASCCFLNRQFVLSPPVVIAGRV
ncbi:unnamed protein product, partial [Linum tenue]